MSRRPVRVSIVSRAPVVARGLRALLGPSSGLMTIIEPTSEAARRQHRDVVLYDLEALRYDGGTTLGHLVRTHPVVVGIEADGAPDLTEQARRVGVVGTVGLSVTRAELLDFITTAVSRRARALESDRRAELTRLGLTQRELEALAGVADGLTNQQIADRHFLSINTVKSNLRRAYQKIGVRSRAQAVAWYLRWYDDRPQPRSAGRTSRP